MSDTAYTLFPSDAPGEIAAKPLVAAVPQITPAPQATPKQAMRVDNVDPAKLFASEQMPDPAASVEATLEPFASSAWFDGDHDRAAELRAASDTLAEDFRQAGTAADQVSEIMGLTREFQGNLMAGPLPEEMIRQQTERACQALAEAGVTDADLVLARRLVDDMERKTPGLKAYLDQTGMGSDPRTVQAAIKEARRRYGR